ncbi:type II secretion system protein GspL, partial [Escherichia coli O157:H7]
MEGGAFPDHSATVWINDEGGSLKKNNKHVEAGRLFLRLPEDDSEPLLWRLIAPEETGAGSVAVGETDPQLVGLLSRYPAWVLVPSGRIAFHQVTLPHRTWRQRLQVLPFLLEEQLATDIEQ